ncbi:hypothetical protein BGZ60DRAFT_466844 [Tricladium varicosporioides]|nr:hypothetical protein BGZ60DRAFT_466844 [Hymenoscyphus varicosporioides]
MPALSSTSLFNTLVTRNASTISSSTNATGPALQVVCAWPVSGQYGPGSRALYYILIAACVFARKAEWLRNACLAAALLFPAVAAFHAIVLTIIHVDNAVDMDVYGAFQLCSIGILAAPVTVRLSRTYFYDPGRNTIFLWTGLVLSGLLSLTVEFFRIKTFDCLSDNSGDAISPTLLPKDFLYGSTCGLTCSVDQGPFSPLRRGSANNIYVIPAPHILAFGSTTLLASACCIPAILSLVSMWKKILKINWKSRFGHEDDECMNEPIEGTNGATEGKMISINSLIRSFQSAVEVPIFGAAVLAILIIGERNFWSHEVLYQTEPIASIGQWAPLLGSGLAVLGSLYMLFAKDKQALEKEGTPNGSTHQCNCSIREVDRNIFTTSPQPLPFPSPSPGTTDVTDARGSRNSSNGARETSPEVVSTIDRPPLIQGQHLKESHARSPDEGSRRKIAHTLTAIGNYLGNPAPDRFDDSEFKHGPAIDFPEIPGEDYRNRALPQIREQYNPSRDAGGHITPSIREHSRSRSVARSVTSGAGCEGGETKRGASPQSPRSPVDQAPFNRQITAAIKYA